MFRIFWQVRIGEVRKKDYQNAKRIKKKQIVNDGIYEEFWISNVYFFLKTFHDFPKFFAKLSNP